MKLLTVIGEAHTSLGKNKLQTLLSILGIVIGVASVITVVATSGVTSVAGDHLADYSSTFTTAANPTTNRPSVGSIADSSSKA